MKIQNRSRAQDGKPLIRHEVNTTNVIVYIRPNSQRVIPMSSEYESLVDRLQGVIRDRRSKRVPYLNSVVDALGNVRKRANEWFNQVADSAREEIEILEELFPLRDFSDRKSKITNLMKRFSECSAELEEILRSVKQRRITSLSELIEGKKSLFRLTEKEPSFIKPLVKMFEVASELEEILRSLDERVEMIADFVRIAEMARQAGSS